LHGSTPPPWDIGRPQPVFVRLAERGQKSGHVLDAGLRHRRACPAGGGPRSAGHGRRPCRPPRPKRPARRLKYAAVRLACRGRRCRQGSPAAPHPVTRQRAPPGMNPSGLGQVSRALAASSGTPLPHSRSRVFASAYNSLGRNTHLPRTAWAAGQRAAHSAWASSESLRRVLYPPGRTSARRRSSCGPLRSGHSARYERVEKGWLAYFQRPAGPRVGARGWPRCALALVKLRAQVRGAAGCLRCHHGYLGVALELSAPGSGGILPA
jgi:hypothetical protein